MENIINKKFGHLTVLHKSDRKAASGSMWVCKCDCGKITIVPRCGLTSGHTKSCGCSRNKFLSEAKPSKKHGYKKERLYRVWEGMKERCSNPNHNRYEIYGGRGISVCSEWNDYLTFRSWAINNGYDPLAPRGKCTIDRIDPNGNYCPENCRFIDMHIQRMNQRRMLENGKQ